MIPIIKASCFIIFFFFLSLFLFLRLNGPIPFFVNGVQTTKTNIFHAEGTGKVTAAPNTAIVSFSVEKNAQTVSLAQNQVNTTVDKLLQGLQTVGINTKDISTTDYSVNPQYDQSTQQRIIGYTVSQNMQVKIQPIDKANSAIDSITASGATNVSIGDLTFDDDTYAKLQQQAREKAVGDAKIRAQNLAHAAGIRLGNIVDVQENNTVPGPQPFMANVAKVADGTNHQTNITPGKTDITSSVTLSYIVY